MTRPERRYRAVLLDFDGTYADTAPDMIGALNQLRARADRPPVDYATARPYVSHGSRALVNLGFGDYSRDQQLRLVADFLDAYESNVASNTRAFDGIDDWISQLEENSIRWGIVTNKPRGLSELLLEALNLTERCHVLVCPDDVTHTKPDPEPMYLAAKQLNITPECIVYVGDHPRDIDAGRAAGMPTVLAAYGYLPPAYRHDLDAWNADYIIHNVSALADLIHQSTQQSRTEQVL